MPEGMNVEIAHKLAESEHGAGTKSSFWSELIEIAEAVVLAVVAVATAVCGYQSAKWDGKQALLYASSARLRVEAAVAGEEARQFLLFDAITLNAWINAKQSNDEKLTAAYQRRFTPEFRKSFEAWLTTDPLRNPDAPAGPYVMPGYHNARLEQAKHLNQEAEAVFAEGTEAREIAERYVRDTVLLATVLFLVALAQRFKLRKVRVGLFIVAAGLMIYTLVDVAMIPRA